MSNAQPSESMAKPIPIEILSESEEEQEEKEEGGGHASMAIDEDRPRENVSHSEEEDDHDESDDQSVHESDDESSFSDDGQSSRKRGQGSLKPPQKQRKRQRPPSPVLVDGVETWSVDRILAEDLDENGEVVYLIKWEGYLGADSWEPFSSIEQCDEALEKWENEKSYQIKHARSNQLGPDGKLLHPIVDHTEKKKKKPSHRCSYAAHQAWILKQCEKALAEDRRKELNQAKAKQKSAREEERKLKRLKREQQASVSQPQTEAQSQSSSSSSSSSSSISTLPSSVKESPQERRNREEKERIEQERVGEERINTISTF